LERHLFRSVAAEEVALLKISMAVMIVPEIERLNIAKLVPVYIWTSPASRSSAAIPTALTVQFVTKTPTLFSRDQRPGLPGTWMTVEISPRFCEYASNNFPLPSVPGTRV